METSNDATTVAGNEPLMVKSCCAAAYQSDWATLLLGESFHPGGLALTERLGRSLGLGPGHRVLDVAAGKGTSAIHLAKTFGCEVVGIDFGADFIALATEAARAAGVAHLTRFEEGDAETLVFAGEQFDAVICECAFCTFPNKSAAAAEFARVLTPGGQVGLTDLTRHGAVPADLQGLLAWVACIADALPLDDYARYLQSAGLNVTLVEEHDDALARLVHDVRTKLMAAELVARLKQVKLPIGDFDYAKVLARSAAEAVRAQRFGYALLIASKHR